MDQKQKQLLVIAAAVLAVVAAVLAIGRQISQPKETVNKFSDVPLKGAELSEKQSGGDRTGDK